MTRLFIMAALAGTLISASGAMAHPVSQTSSGFRHAWATQPPVQSPLRSEARRGLANPAHDVYVNGQYVGADPDPGIRLQLARDNWLTQW